MAESRVPAERLLPLVPDPLPWGGEGWGDKLYGRKAWVEDISAALGVTTRTAQRWLSEIVNGGTLILWTADDICAYAGVPFRSVYPELD